MTLVEKSLKENCVIIITYQPLIYDRLWREPMIPTCFQVVSPEKFWEINYDVLKQVKWVVKL